MAPSLMNRWMIAGCVLVGIWLFISPWVVADTASPPSSWNFHIAGVLTVFLAILALMRSDDFAEYGLVAVAVWLFISPWVLDLPQLVTKQVIFYGVILGCLALFGRSSLNAKPGA